MVGSLTGAQLKQDKQKEEVCPSGSLLFCSMLTRAQAIRSFREIGPEEQIAMLQDQRGHLLDQKVMLQRKLDAFHETVQDRAREKQAKADRK